MVGVRTSIGVVGDLDAGIAEFARLVDAEHEAILRDATGRVSNALVREALVDTGEMVADWDVAIGDFPSDTKPPADPKRSTTRARLKEGFADLKIGQSVFFENTDPAAIQQEIGNLKRQPNGLARLVARKWPSFVKGAATAAQNRIKKTLVFE